jgi:hypothetical protein
MIIGNPVAIGAYASNTGRYITEGSLVEFAAPTGYYFTATNQTGSWHTYTARRKAHNMGQPYSSVSIRHITRSGQFAIGNRPGSFEQLCSYWCNSCSSDSGVFTTDIPTSIQQTVVAQIALNQNFGLGYNNLTDTWYVITSNNLDCRCRLESGQCTKHCRCKS